MIFKKILQGEILEFDCLSLREKEKTNLFYLFLIRLIHFIYKNTQRLILKPKYRNILKNIEILLLKKNYNEKITSSLIKKLEELRSNNFCYFDNLFNSLEIKKLSEEFKNENNLIDVYTGNKNFSYKNKPASARMGYILTEKIFNNDFVLEAANNKNLINLLNNYFNCKYSFDWAWAWWSFKSHEQDHGPQNFHRDYESLNFVKIFVYLTDVNSDKDGPHEFVLGSSYTDDYFKRERFNKADINNKFKNNIKKIIGSSGTTFIADTYGIHRGVKPISNDRLILVLLYSAFPTNRSPKIPPFYISNLKNKNLFLKNKYLNRLFINFDK